MIKLGRHFNVLADFVIRFGNGVNNTQGQDADKTPKQKHRAHGGHGKSVNEPHSVINIPTDNIGDYCISRMIDKSELAGKKIKITQRHNHGRNDAIQ